MLTKNTHRNMAKKEQEQIERLSVQDYLINALDKPVAVKGGGYLKDPTDGHEMTAMEAMSMKVMQNALNGDLKSIQFIMQLEQAHRLQQQRKKIMYNLKTHDGGQSYYNYGSKRWRRRP